MPYWQLFYHMVWSTKNRQPLLEANVEAVIYDFLRAKAIGLGATVFALNGIVDHVHMVAAIPPKIAVATFIGQIKAVASTKFNKSDLSEVPFFWQDEYEFFHSMGNGCRIILLMLNAKKNITPKIRRSPCWNGRMMLG